MADVEAKAEHYFTADPTSEGPAHEFAFAWRGREFTFTTAAGVFSRAHVDRGTRLLLEALPLPLAGAGLDLGCGYGVIGIVAAALSPEATVTLVDVNARAVALAAQNAQANGIDVEVLQSDAFASLGDRHYDWIATNPPYRGGQAVVDRFVLDGASHLQPGGSLYFVARTKQGARRLAERVGQRFAAVEELEKGGGFRVYQARGPLDVD